MRSTTSTAKSCEACSVVSHNSAITELTCRVRIKRTANFEFEVVVGWQKLVPIWDKGSSPPYTHQTPEASDEGASLSE